MEKNTLHIFLFSCGILGALCISLVEGDDLNWYITLPENCTADAYENGKHSSIFENGKLQIEDGIKYLYENETEFQSVLVKDFKCSDGVIFYVIVCVENRTDVTKFQKIFQDDLSDSKLQTSATTQVAVVSYNFTALPWNNHPFSLYAEIDTKIANYYFCPVREQFKSNLASRLILLDGISTVNPNQIVIFKHFCNDKAFIHNLAEDVQFYVSKNGYFGEPDFKLTMLAYRVVEQMVYDGTTWKLGLHFYKYLSNIQLLGSERPDFGLSSFQITYIGVGAVAVVILLIIITVYIASCCHSRLECCGNSDEKEEQYQKDSIEIPALLRKDERGYTNELFLEEKKHVEETANVNVVEGEYVLEVEYSRNNSEVSSVGKSSAVNDEENHLSSTPSYIGIKIGDTKDLNGVYF